MKESRARFEIIRAKAALASAALALDDSDSCNSESR